ncbi:tRNA pseudouridine(38-40) synthase TruA [Halopenitus persicus]|uniref:tRNA pseudouridine synthase A n=1 Tax=Halopenitus persicus TaxID=1048396 RepID=A0A1H3KYN4_9EURY|nr:tRNA pseudouridine(38-40) synthase TruA [Halopenitus persicus]SDY57282.1 tRNA pseudouridine38-40 synthase [Halopenitus persicus]
MRAFRIAYDGRPFSGFQRQPDVPTVEDVLFDALDALDVADLPRDPSGGRPRPPGYAAAGRTDAGVSAAAQTITLNAPDWLTPRAFNGQLPKQVRVWAAADVPEDFHATHDATRRTYRYHLYAPRDAGSPADGRTDAGVESGLPAAAPLVDDDRVRTALARLAGEHDFHNLTPDERGTVRTIETGVDRDADLLVIEVSAGGFPREFVRRLVTLVRAIGTGDAPLSRIDRLLAAEPASGPDGVGPAPPTPLVLWDVDYVPSDAPDTVDRTGQSLQFDPDPEAVASACVAFGEEHTSARHAAAATDALRRRIGSEPSSVRRS